VVIKLSTESVRPGWGGGGFVHGTASLSIFF